MALSPNIRGALLMTGSMTAFTVNDTFLKLLGADLPLFQMIFLRSIGVLVLLGGFTLWRGALRLPEGGKDRWLILARCLAEMGATWFFITALLHMPIANVSAIMQALPLTVTLAAAMFLSEPVGWRRFLAIAVGFLGVFLIVRPGADGFTVYSVYAICAVLCVTFRDLAARQVSREVPSLTVALAAVVFIGAFSAVGSAFEDWRSLSLINWVWLLAGVVTILLAYVFSVMAMRVGEIGAVAPFRYSSLIVALILGYLVFGDWPDFLTLIGAGIVVATGLFTLWRERAVIHKTPTPSRMR